MALNQSPDSSITPMSLDLSENTMIKKENKMTTKTETKTTITNTEAFNALYAQYQNRPTSSLNGRTVFEHKEAQVGDNSFLFFEVTNPTNSYGNLSFMQTEWDSNLDLSISGSGSTLREAEEAIKAMRRFLTGNVHGGQNFVSTVPLELLATARNINQAGFVFKAYSQADAIEFTNPETGAKTLIGVEGKLPQTGWSPVKVKGNMVIAKKKEWTPLTGGKFDYCEALATLASGRNISVTLGPNTIIEARRLFPALEDGTMAEEILIKQQSQAQKNKLYQTERVVAEEIRMAANPLELTADQEAKLMVPSVNGGFYNLAKHNAAEVIHVVDQFGLAMGSARKLRDASYEARLHFAEVLRLQGLFVSPKL